MKFDRLVFLTHTYLAAKRKKKIISIETVHEVLAETGIADLIQQTSSLSNRGRIRLSRLYIRGHKWQAGKEDGVPFEYRRTFGPVPDGCG